MIAIDPTDTDYEDLRVKAVTREGDQWVVVRDDEWTFRISDERNAGNLTPKVGDVARFYGKGIGFPVRGLAINGLAVFYETEAEYQARFAREHIERNRVQREEFEANRPDYEARVDRLPAAFRHRIHLRQKNNPDFDWEYGSYELFVCEQAVVIAETMETPEAIAAWADHSVPWGERQRRVPGLSDGHSGNTFGAAAYLAQQYLVDPVVVPAVRGAMSMVVGSVAYGDVSPAEVASLGLAETDDQGRKG